MASAGLVVPHASPDLLRAASTGGATTPWTLLLALTIGLLGLALFGLALTYAWRRGDEARRAVLDLVVLSVVPVRELATPSARRRMPRRELRRRRIAAIEDLDAALGGGPTSRERAEAAAYEEAAVRAGLLQDERNRREREQAYARSRERQQRTREREVAAAAEARAHLDRAHLAASSRDVRYETAGEAQHRSALARAEAALAAERLAAREARTQRAEAAWLAHEARERAEAERSAEQVDQESGSRTVDLRSVQGRTSLRHGESSAVPLADERGRGADSAADGST